MVITNAVCKQTGVSISTVRKYLKLLELSPELQAKLTTSDGPAGVSALAKIAESFRPEDQEEALSRIGGFKQSIQIEMINASGRDLATLEDLREEALEGAFEIKECRGIERCPYIPDELIKEVTKMIEDHQTDKS